MFLLDKELEELYSVVKEMMPIFEDESNADITYKRNRIRSQMIPILHDENMNFYRFYWNMHSWDTSTLQSLSESQIRISENINLNHSSVSKDKKTYFYIPGTSFQDLDSHSTKQILDFYLSLLGKPPLYRKPFEDFQRQSLSGRGQIDTADFLIDRDTQGNTLIINKDSQLLQQPLVLKKYNLIEVIWNGASRSFQDEKNIYSIRNQNPGEFLQLFYGKKELTEIFRENRIPVFLRNLIPIVYKKNLPIQILFSMFDSSLSDFPKNVNLSQ
jgi:tRNA(Ile)-lysidine synthetase-like protein